MGLADYYTLRSVLTFSSRERSRPDHPNGHLRTRFLVMDRKAAWRVAAATIEGLGGQWNIEEETPSSGQFHLTRRTTLRQFVQDVTVSIWVAPDGAGVARGRMVALASPAPRPVARNPDRVGVDVVSTSRTGLIDFGQNARNIRDFYRALEAYLQNVDPPGAGDGPGRPDHGAGAPDHGAAADPRLAAPPSPARERIASSAGATGARPSSGPK